MPFVHWLPKRWQAGVVRRVTPWDWITRPGAVEREFYLKHYLKDVYLLTREELQNLFPNARIRKERFLGWTKSLIAVQR
jgi:hypothetical protein